MITGVVYGVVLNDKAQRAALGDALAQAPYGRPPVAPVLYIKPRTCVRTGGAATPIPDDLAEVEIAATLALLFGPDPGVIVAACLALEISQPHQSYFRPAIRQRCRDGFLPLGGFAPFDDALARGEIVTRVDGAVIHRWSLSRLQRDIATLIVDVGEFMTLQAGDLLLVGLPGDAPRARAGQSVAVEMAGMPPLSARLEPEMAA